MNLTELYLEHQNFIESCAKKTAKRYGCGNMLEDLLSAGTIAFLEQINRYDEKQDAAVTTFLHPYIMGAMRREVEKNSSPFSLSRREFEQIHKNGLLARTRFVSLDEPDEGGNELYDSVPASQTPIEQQVYLKIRHDYLQTAFDSLSFKEREILGSSFGFSGHKKQTLAEIGEAFQMKENAVLKAKNRALGKLRMLCVDRDLDYWRVNWRSARTAMRLALRNIGCEPHLCCPAQILAEQVLTCLECEQSGASIRETANQKIRVLALRAVLGQLEFKAPETALKAFIRLTRLGRDPLAAMERIAAVLLEEVYYILKYNSGYNAKRYSRKLRLLCKRQTEWTLTD